jgi:hypothetical protein
MKSVIAAAACAGVLMGAATLHAETPKKAKPGAVVLELYYNAQSATITRSNNVAKVTNPSTGTYCITPLKAVDANAIYPVASAEYITSGWVPFGAYVTWQDTTVATDCAPGDLEVRTIYNGGLQPAFSFSLVVFQ